MSDEFKNNILEEIQPENIANPPSPAVSVSSPEVSAPSPAVSVPNTEPAYYFWAEQIAANQQKQMANSFGQPTSPPQAVNPGQPTNTAQTAGFDGQPSQPTYPVNGYAPYPPNGYAPYQTNYIQNQSGSYQTPHYQNQPLQYTPNPHANNNYSEIPGASFSQQPKRGVKNKHRGRFKKGCMFVAYSAIFGLIAAAVFIGANELYYSVNPSARPAVAAEANQTKNPSKLEINPATTPTKQIPNTTIGTNQAIVSTDVSEVVESVMPSIVMITSTVLSNSWYGQYESDGGGSGFIIDETKDEILIATNNHVVENSKKIMVTLNDGKSYEATIRGTDPTSDLAVISIKTADLTEESKKSYQVAKLGDSDQIRVGQMAIAIGNALGYGQSVTVGYISAKDREVTIDSDIMVLLQTDAAINPGNSGGALLNVNGEVIGINSVKYTASSVEGMGFAIPISKAIAILDELKTREVIDEADQGYLGVSITSITEEYAASYNWPVGILVKEVTKNGAAEISGILAHDIITAINDVPVKTSEQLKQKVNSYRSGTTIKVTLSRMIDGKFEEMTFDVKLQPNPELNSTTENDINKAPDVTKPVQEMPDIETTPENEFNPFYGFENSPWD